MRLYHYTLAQYLQSIQKEGLRPSVHSAAKQGNGHYLTDLPPDIAEKFSCQELYNALFSSPKKWEIDGELQDIVFIEFKLEDEKLKRVFDLFPGQVQKTYSTLGIWLHSSEEVLAADRIESWGLIRFQAMPSSN